MSRSDFLAQMAESSRRRAAEANALESEAALEARARAAPAAPPLRLDGFDIIAELKLRSPAAGTMAAAGFDRGSQLAAYARGGACAVSVLTEPEAFHGSLTFLAEASAALSEHACPTMRKDFLTNPYQVLEARAAGAGGVLIIVTMLDDVELGELLACAREHGLFVLLECFGRDDLERVAQLRLAAHRAPVLAGVNSRDLRSLEVRFARFAELADALPQNLPVVAESGIATTADIESIVASGYEAALVGSALMANDDPAAALVRLIATGRHAAESVCR